MKSIVLVVLALVAVVRADVYAVPEGTVVDQWHEPPMPDQLQPTNVGEAVTGPLLPSNLQAKPEDLERAERDDDAFFAHASPDMESDRVSAELEDARDAMGADDFDSFLELEVSADDEEEHDSDSSDDSEDQDNAETQEDESVEKNEHEDNDDQAEDNNDEEVVAAEAPAPEAPAADAATDAAAANNEAPAAEAPAAEAPASSDAAADSNNDARTSSGILTDPEDATRLKEEADEDAWDLDNVDFQEGHPSLKNEFADVMLEMQAAAEDHDDAHTEIHLGEAADADEDEHHAVTLDDAKEILEALDINPISE